MYSARVLTATERPPDARCCGWLDVWHGCHAPPALKILLPTGSHAGGPLKALLIIVGGYSFTLCGYHKHTGSFFKVGLNQYKRIFTFT